MPGGAVRSGSAGFRLRSAARADGEVGVLRTTAPSLLHEPANPEVASWGEAVAARTRFAGYAAATGAAGTKGVPEASPPTRRATSTSPTGPTTESRSFTDLGSKSWSPVAVTAPGRFYIPLVRSEHQPAFSFGLIPTLRAAEIDDRPRLVSRSQRAPTERALSRREGRPAHRAALCHEWVYGGIRAARKRQVFALWV